MLVRIGTLLGRFLTNSTPADPLGDIEWGTANSIEWGTGNSMQWGAI